MAADDVVNKADPAAPPPAPGNAPLTWGQAPASGPNIHDPNANTSLGYVPVMNSGMTYTEVGSYGLRAFSGWVREEFLPSLQGRQAAQKYREMMDNSPIINAIMVSVTATMRKVNWRVEPADDTPAGQEGAEFVESLMGDMSHSWEDSIVEDLSMLGYGFAPKEIVYKKRLGRDPGMDPRRPGQDLPKSEYDDGLIGWRKLPIRGQDTVLKWFFDENGEVKGMTQMPYTGAMLDLPIEKMLLFRPSQHKNNPEGRALDPETLMATPAGWRKLDDLQPGDFVFDEAGRPTKICARADWFDRPSYRVTFSDGSEIIADENHEWLTQTLYERGINKPARRRTTRQIARRVTTKQHAPIHSIPWAAPLQYRHQDLPLDPYLFGLWLGDGHKNSPSVTCHSDDAEAVVAAVAAAGFASSICHNGRPGALSNSVRAMGAMAVLRQMGVAGNKHVPNQYLRSAISQRLSLLQGLMDSDGHVTEIGQCEFANTNFSLITAVAELLRSLGCGKLGIRQNKKLTTGGNPAWKITFSPPFVPFALPRKAAKCQKRDRRTFHYITRVEPVENRRTTCIEVEAESHLFLAGLSLVPTSNSILRSSYVPYYFVKRMQEQEAILGERMGGLPVVKVPSALIANAATGDPNATAALNAYKRMAMNIRIDEQMGILIPSDMHPGPNGPSTQPMYSFELATPQGGRGMALNFNETIQRYDNKILTSVLADFISMGHDARGAQNLGETKVDMFFQAIEGFLNSNASVYNKHAIPRLWRLNGFDMDVMPKLVPDLAQRIDLDSLSNFVLHLSQAGMPIFPNEDIQSFLLEAGGLPDMVDDRAMQAAGLLEDQLNRDDESADVALDAAKNPPDPKANSNFEKMILASIARRLIRKGGPKFGISTGKKKHAAKRR